jgi:hypothetical protein
MKSSTAVTSAGLLLLALALLGVTACTSTTVGVGWGVSVAGGPYGPYGPYEPYGSGVHPTVGVGVYGRPY